MGEVSEGSTFKLDFAGLLGVHYGENVLEVCLCGGHSRLREQHIQRPCCLLSLSLSPACPLSLSSPSEILDSHRASGADKVVELPLVRQATRESRPTPLE